MNILIIAPSWVGDMMMSHSLYQTLKQQYPDCQIDVLAPNWCKPLLARMPEVRNALTMPIGHGAFSLGERYKIGKALRNQYNMAIVLPNSLKSAFIPLFAKIPVRRGWKGESRYCLLNDLRSNKHDYPMMVQRYVALGYEKGKIPTAQNLNIPTPYLTVDESAVQKTKEILLTIPNGIVRGFAPVASNVEIPTEFSTAQFALAENRPAIGFCPGAEFGPAKRWPHYHYAKLAERLIEQGYSIRLFGSNKDVEVGEQIRLSLPESLQHYCVNLAGQTELNQAVDLIADCTAMVTNDSGLMHIAAAVGRPLVAVYGPTSPEYTPPLSDKAVIIRLIKGGLIKIRKGADSAEGYHQSLIDITPEMVLEKLMPLLAN
ncbi:lipopolysaccharide heptosyltransferase II [Lonepinella koalarum]|uniref:lipopolysaccharide heptosyltransferase II n=1 Tax=Lonepinella koalarum TaxID=53417 RepID=UPI0011E4278E|nr:lipopolysaccharide heptosyltransferase II [Lonepinella koalarum]TYG34552.1 lipopolysaccharide heptosyltransferase II [Lonepinella koalarum]